MGAQLLSACVCGTRVMRTWSGDYVCGVCGGGTEVERVFSTVSADGGLKMLSVVLLYSPLFSVIPRDSVPFASDPVILPTGQRVRTSKRVWDGHGPRRL